MADLQQDTHSAAPQSGLTWKHGRRLHRGLRACHWSERCAAVQAVSLHGGDVSRVCVLAYILTREGNKTDGEWDGCEER